MGQTLIWIVGAGHIIAAFPAFTVVLWFAMEESMEATAIVCGMFVLISFAVCWTINSIHKRSIKHEEKKDLYRYHR